MTINDTTTSNTSQVNTESNNTNTIGTTKKKRKRLTSEQREIVRSKKAAAKKKAAEEKLKEEKKVADATKKKKPTKPKGRAKKPMGKDELKLYLTDIIKGNVLDGLTRREPSIADKLKAIDQLNKIYNDEEKANNSQEVDIQAQENQANTAIQESLKNASEENLLAACGSDN